MARPWWERAADLLARAGVAFAFLYPPFDALFNFDSWIGYFPHFLRGAVPDAVLLHGFGLVEVIIALWILSGIRIFWPALAATVLLVGIILFNLQDFEIIFRDVTIAALSASLALEAWYRKQTA